ncbi:MAG: ubiquinol-cytochrome c reductase iron-sulfur subunit [Planctomycetales bacterium]|nr:ubiquinol-cytochrome c reductase iron-sulfur subunit [Planctomycetales bacterium]
MSNEALRPPQSSSQALESHGADTDAGRRSFLSTSATLVMGGGLVGGYGTFFAMAGQYFFPSGANRQWIFVSDADSIAPGESMPFQSPDGVAVMITRRSEELAEKAEDGTEAKLPPTVDSFLALSSVCPHLGCRVHWEGNNNRFFCPCHNGVFDANGVATGGPPAAEGQNLPHYTLQIIDGALYIEMPTTSIGRSA